MMRFLIFTALFPPLVPLVYIAADPVLLRDPPGTDFLLWLMAFAYVIAIIPAWLTAGVDWALSSKPLYLRLIVVMPMAAIMGVLSARYGFGQKGEYLYFGSMGAIPAAVCSWLSALAQDTERVES